MPRADIQRRQSIDILPSEGNNYTQIALFREYNKGLSDIFCHPMFVEIFMENSGRIGNYEDHQNFIDNFCRNRYRTDPAFIRTIQEMLPMSRCNRYHPYQIDGSISTRDWIEIINVPHHFVGYPVAHILTFHNDESNSWEEICFDTEILAQEMIFEVIPDNISPEYTTGLILELQRSFLD